MKISSADVAAATMAVTLTKFFRSLRSHAIDWTLMTLSEEKPPWQLKYFGLSTTM
jgi:hypothetical protein